MTDFTINSATLYRAGIGWFLATGESDSGSIYFPVSKNDLDDFLKTSIISVKDGSGFKNLSFDTSQRELLFDFDEAFLGILEFLKGSNCTIDYGTKKIEGKILGYQQFDEEGERIIVSVLSDEGIVNLKPDKIRNLIPNNSNLQDKLNEFLAGMASDSDTVEQKMLRIGLSSDTNQEVFVQFLSSVPAWKLTYRLLLEETKSELQMYAIVDNTTLVDFIDANLVLSTKLPVSFRYDLSTPHLISRQVIARKTDTGITVERKSSTRSAMKRKVMAASAIMTDSDEDFGFYDEEEAAEGMHDRGLSMSSKGGRLDSQADIEASESVEFVLKNPVTIRKNESSMVPLTSIEVDAKNKHYFNKTNHNRHPFRIIEFENTEEYAIDEGPISVHDRSRNIPLYQGEAMLNRIASGEHALILYALDRDVDIKQTENSRTEYIGFEIRGYYYRQKRTNYRIHKFEINNNTSEDIHLYLAITKSSYQFTNQNLDYKDSYDEFRMINTVKSQSSDEVEYEMFYEDYSETRLISYSIKDLKGFLDKLDLKAEDQNKLKEIITHKETLQKYELDLQEVQKKMERLSVRREQIISSLEVLEEGSSDQDVRSTYVKSLTEVDRDLHELTQKIEDLEEKIKIHRNRSF